MTLIEFIAAIIGINVTAYVLIMLIFAVPRKSYTCPERDQCDTCSDPVGEDSLNCDDRGNGYCDECYNNGEE